MKISIGGAIGVGKTTYCKILHKELKLPYIQEFDENNPKLITMLNWLYEDMDTDDEHSEVELILQTYFINHTHKLHLKNNLPIEHCITDRHIIEHERFAYYNLRHKDPLAYSYYMSLFNAVLSRDKLPDLYIILDGSFEYCLNNMKKRNRESEMKNLEKNMEYFKRIHADYTLQLSSRCVTFDVPFKILNVENNEHISYISELKNDKKYLGDTNV